MATVVTQYSDKPPGMSGREWRRMRSAMRREGSGPMRMWFHRAWRAAREGYNSDYFPGRMHRSDIARRTATACLAAREATP